MEFVKDDDELKNLAKICIDEFELLENLRDYIDEVRIGYQWSDENKIRDNMIVYADCEKVKPKLKEFIDYDFIITFYEAAKDICENAKKVLMYHELRHIGIKESENGDLSFYIVQHTIQDFREIVEKYGLDWQTTIE